MKRKIFTSMAAAGLLICSIATASAAQQPQNSDWICLYWKDPCYGIQAPAVPDTPEQIKNGSMTQTELSTAKLINQMRQKNGLAPLKIDANLSVNARIKSNDMKVNRYFSHNSPTYGTPFQMMKRLGIAYKSAGENIAMGYTSARAVVQAWMNSQSHRDNILSTKYTSMGIGYVDGYWTQWFIG